VEENCETKKTISKRCKQQQNEQQQKRAKIKVTK
jgi:hypothetical protein